MANNASVCQTHEDTHKRIGYAGIHRQKKMHIFHGMAMRMIKNQKFNPKMKENKLWASENRSPTERRQCKLVSKLKKLLIEQDKHDPKNVIVSYKWFHVRVRNGRTFTNVATVSEDGEVLWAEDIGQVSATVKECMAEIEANME